MILDLVDGTMPIDATASAAWDHYKKTAVFIKEKVVWSQFEQRYKDHVKQTPKSKSLSDQPMEALLFDRTYYPRQTKNDRGELTFDLSEAKMELRADVADGKHLKTTLLELQRTRQSYKQFSSKKFKEHIYQKQRRKKFVAVLELKRVNEKKKKEQLRGINEVPVPEDQENQQN